MSQFKNELTLVGKVVNNREGNPSTVTFTPAGTPILKFQLNVPYEKKGENGSKVLQNSFFYVTAWGKYFEETPKILAEGAVVEVKAYLQNRSWPDKVTNKKMYRMEISARDIKKVE